MLTKNLGKRAAAEVYKEEVLDCEFQQVRFDSSGSELFRVTVTSVSDGTLIWMENKKTKQQWQLTVSDVREFGPGGIPSEAVFAFLKKALSLASASDDVITIEKDDPAVDALLRDGEVTLTLTCSIASVWKPKFSFSLLPVALDKVDVLDAKLRDTQEELKALKNQTPPFLKVSSSDKCEGGDFITWNAIASRLIRDDCFRMSDNRQEVQVLQSGVYSIHVQLTAINGDLTALMALQLNGSVIAQCFQCCSDGYQCTGHISEVIPLDINDILQVRCGDSVASNADPTTNHFTIVIL